MPLLFNNCIPNEFSNCRRLIFAALMILCPYEIFSMCPVSSSQCFSSVSSFLFPLQPLNLLHAEALHSLHPMTGLLPSNWFYVSLSVSASWIRCVCHIISDLKLTHYLKYEAGNFKPNIKTKIYLYRWYPLTQILFLKI